MNHESLIASIIFWLSFTFSPGPFWIAWMNLHAKSDFWPPYKPYLLNLILTFSTLCFLLAFVVLSFGQFNQDFLLPLYFIGAAYIFYLAFHAFNAQQQDVRMNFGFKEMFILCLTNPKVYLTIPAGALSAQYFDNNIVLNSFMFSHVLQIPIVLCGSLFFALLGRLSNRVAMNKLGYVSTLLLIIYGVYLLSEGVSLVRI